MKWLRLPDCTAKASPMWFWLKVWRAAAGIRSCGMQSPNGPGVQFPHELVMTVIEARALEMWSCKELPSLCFVLLACFPALSGSCAERQLQAGHRQYLINKVNYYVIMLYRYLLGTFDFATTDFTHTVLTSGASTYKKNSPVPV